MTPRRSRARARGRQASFAAWLAGLAIPTIAAAAETATPAASPCATRGPEHPDLSAIRTRDPGCRRTLWLGIDAGGVALPRRLSGLGRDLWTVHIDGAWALRLASWASIGGRHGVRWYDAGNVRVRAHDQFVELAAHPLVAAGHRRLHDRLSLGLQTHTIFKYVVDGTAFRLGGVRDVVLGVGYGIEHHLGERWAIAWQAQVRQAWVFKDTQRQLRLALRATFWPRPDHMLAAEIVGYGIDRDARQGGQDLPRRSLVGQAALDYAWISRVGVGPAVRVRYTTAFLSGEAPVYEVRNEALRTSYAEALVGLRAVWR